jgi:hypothetical protein
VNNLRFLASYILIRFLYRFLLEWIILASIISDKILDISIFFFKKMAFKSLICLYYILFNIRIAADLELILAPDVALDSLLIWPLYHFQISKYFNKLNIVVFCLSVNPAFRILTYIALSNHYVFGALLWSYRSTCKIIE